MQSAYEQPPSAFAYLNRDLFQEEDDPGSIDLFKYYLDLSSSSTQQQQSQPQQLLHQKDQLTASTPIPHPLSLADIDSFQSLLTNAQAQQQQQQPSLSLPDASTSHLTFNNPSPPALFPFAEAFAETAPLPFSTATTTALPPPATLDPLVFSASTASSGSYPVIAGSEVPIDPRWTLHQPVVNVKTEPIDVPVSMHKKRGVSEMSMEEMSENEEAQDEDDHEDDDDDEEDDQQPSDSNQRRPKRKLESSASSQSKKGSSSHSPSSIPNKKAASSHLLNQSTIKKGTTASISHPHALVPVPDWEDRLSKEEYDKLSSKEKRQMRNKISARNFRHRRKAHIDTLEAEINGKDRLIDGLKEEVGTLRSENQGLRADIDILKKNWESIAAKISASTSFMATTATAHSPMNRPLTLTPEEEDLYGTASLPALSPASSSASTNGDAESLFDTHASTSSITNANTLLSSATSASTASSASSSHSQRKIATRSSTNAKPNLRKDISPSTGTAFWDTNPSLFEVGIGGGRNRAMDVHTTLVPELNLSGSPAAAAAELFGKKRDLCSSSLLMFPPSPSPYTSANNHNYAYGGNMNPALNGLTDAQLNTLRDQYITSSAQQYSSNSTTNKSAAASGAFGAIKVNERLVDPLKESFFDTNPFLLLRNDHLQDYRGQLYTKLANNVAGLQATHHANKAGLPSHSIIAAGLRPAFFSSSSSSSPSSSSSSLNFNDDYSYSSSVSSALPTPSTTTMMEKNITHVGALATKTLFEKLSSAFWDAFMGDQPTGRPLLLSSSSSSPSPASTSTSMAISAKSIPRTGTALMDPQKVADVIGGKKKLALVCVPSSPSTSMASLPLPSLPLPSHEQDELRDSLDSLEKRLENINLQ